MAEQLTPATPTVMQRHSHRRQSQESRRVTEEATDPTESQTQWVTAGYNCIIVCGCRCTFLGDGMLSSQISNSCQEQGGLRLTQSNPVSEAGYPPMRQETITQILVDKLRVERSPLSGIQATC